MPVKPPTSASANSRRVRCADQNELHKTNETNQTNADPIGPHSGPYVMPNYRRYKVEGAMYFFTVKTENNAPIFADEAAVRLLGDIMRECIERWPFEQPAIVLLPDHLHALWSLPSGDADYSTRWAWIKKEFTKRHLALGGSEQPTSKSKQANRRRGIWQRRFWEHTIKDEADFDAHFDSSIGTQ